MAYTSPPPTAEPLLKEKPFGVCISRHIQAVTFSLIRLAIRSTPCPQFGIVVFEQIIVQILVASLSQPPRASALRQARVSGGNLQNCAPSAACGGAYAPVLFCRWQGRYSGSRMGEGFYSYELCKKLGCLIQPSIPPRLIHAFNKCPRGTPILIGAGWRSQTKGENEESPGRSLLQTERFKFFPATGVGGSAASQFNSIDFYVTTQPSLVLSWAPRKYRIPSPVPPFLTSPRGRTPP